MRCPKCGYISFDHLEECLKCGKNIKAVSEELNGTVFNVVSPAFLVFGDDEENASDKAFTEAFDTGDEYIDEDIEAFIDDGDGTNQEEELDGAVFAVEEDDIPAGISSEDKNEISLADDVVDEDREIEIDMSQFEQEPGGADDDSYGNAAFEYADNNEEGDSDAIPVPAELSDLSDLAPPAVDDLGFGEDSSVPGQEQQKAVTEKPPMQENEEFSLDDLDLDLGLDDLDLNTESVGSKDAAISFDDIDFSEILNSDAGRSDKKTTASSADIGELDFELDLDGLELDKEL